MVWNIALLTHRLRQKFFENIVKQKNILRSKMGFSDALPVPEIFSSILATFALQNFAHVLKIDNYLYKKFWVNSTISYLFDFCNNELERNSNLQLQGAKCCSFFNNRK